MIGGWWDRNKVWVGASMIATCLFMFKYLGDGII